MEMNYLLSRVKLLVVY